MNDEKKFKSIEELLEAREKLDKILEEEFRKEVTIIFTDIKGSTQFFETRGDIEGLSMIRKHNEMHFPTIEAYGGRVVKTIGDAIMAVFEDAASAVRATIEMQNNLLYYNKGKQPSDQIHIRIGINTGVALYKDDDVYGDAVNLAARVESMAEPDHILISDSVYNLIKDTDDIICRFHGKSEFKGKSGETKIYRVVWSEEQLVEESTFKKTGTRRTVKKAAPQKPVFEIDASLEGEHLKVSSYERFRGEEKTIHHYEDIKISGDEISRLCREVTGLLNRANKRGRVSKEILKQLQSTGHLLFDAVLTGDVKSKLASTGAAELILRLDDNLVHIPWELLYDGKQFLCQRFSMGRIVSTRQSVTEGVARNVGKPLKMLVLADPRGDLAHSAEEGSKIRDVLDAESELINANIKSSDVTVDYVKSKIRDFDIIHYAGHADYDTQNPANSGWLLSDGKFSSDVVRNMAGGRPLPALVFANGCQSGTTEQWGVTEDYEEQIFGLANAFLLAGVQHYIGTFWDILDSPGADFAIAFYQEILDGQSIGEAVRRARMELIDRYGEDTIVWASYMLYGDPSRVYIDETEQDIEEDKAEAVTAASPTASASEQPVAAVSGGVRGGAGEAAGVRTKGPSFTKISVGLLAVLLLVLAGVLIAKFTGGEKPIVSQVETGPEAGAYERAFAALRNGNAPRAEQAFLAMSQKEGDSAKGLEGLAAVYYETGKTEQARRKAEQALQQDPGRMYAQVILGKIAVDEGDYASAREKFVAATGSEGGAEWQRAVAYNQLGRIYAAKGNDNQAVDSYQKASEMAPDMTEAKANRGVVLARMGKVEEAQKVLEQAREADPNDEMVASLLRDIAMRRQMAMDSEKQERIRNMVNDLADRKESGDASTSASAGDEWTSRPLTITFLDLRSLGLIPGREGENEFLLLKLTQNFQEDGRVKVVDRAMLEAMLNELNISSSELADPATALRLGRLLSARLIATGSIIRDSESLQVSMRVIETETSDVAVALAETMDRKMSVSKVADKLSGMLLEKIDSSFPVRGAVKEIRDGEVVLNIGSDVGVEQGMKLNLVEPRIRGEGRVLGKVEVSELHESESVATVLEKKVELYKDMKVEQPAR